MGLSRTPLTHSSGRVQGKPRTGEAGTSRLSQHRRSVECLSNLQRLFSPNVLRQVYASSSRVLPLARQHHQPVESRSHSCPTEYLYPAANCRLGRAQGSDRVRPIRAQPELRHHISRGPRQRAPGTTRRCHAAPLRAKSSPSTPAPPAATRPSACAARHRAWWHPTPAGRQSR